ncbi:MAG: hypothetical protein EON91_00875 [Brevundimonas sp.]|uniref:hypothetical protein n=1 Tax=Brevundimonas sp. TaxID=1871086 RepID=UPI00122A8B49|nr:hypothetical protein [Brevundimonas sp.]RZJ19624.1 MAG: hypothetical protein EON91_00875 [Brevundimonas sp.]
MDTVLIVFLACLLDPIRLVPSILAGALVQSWKGVWIASTIIAAGMIGLAVSLGANANPILGPLATLAAVAGAFAIKAGFKKSKKPQLDVAE